MGKKGGRPVNPYGSSWGKTSSWGGPVKPRSPMGGTSKNGCALTALAMLGGAAALVAGAVVEIVRAVA